MNNIYLLASDYSCNNLFTPEAMKIIHEVLGYFRILAPFVLVVLIGIDLFSLIINSDRDPRSSLKYISNIVLRTIAAILVFFVPTIVGIVLSMDGVKSSLMVDPLCLQATGSGGSGDVYEMFGLDSTSPKEPTSSTPTPTATTHAPELGGNNGEVFGNPENGKRARKTVTIKGRTYDSYLQGDFPDVGFSGQNIAVAGCSCVAMTQAASGFKRDLTIFEAAKMFSDRTFEGIGKGLSQLGIPYSSVIYYNSNDYNNSANGKARAEGVVAKVRAHLDQGKPAIAIVQCGPYAGANPHFITLFGEDEQGRLITGNCRKEVGSLEELVANSLCGGRKGFMLVG